MAGLNPLAKLQIGLSIRSLKSIPPILFLAAYFLAAFWLLGLSSIGDSSEAREGQVIWSILNSGEWILPLRNGIVPSKPPLSHWIGAAFGSVLGVSEFSARVPALLGALGVLLITAWITRRVAKFSATYSNSQIRDLGWLTIALLLCTYGFVRMQVDARVDMVFCFWIVAAIGTIVSALEFPLGQAGRVQFNFGPKHSVIFYLCCAFAVLSKGPLGLALPLAISLLLVFACCGRSALLSLIFRPISGWLPFLALTFSFFYHASMLSPQNKEINFIARQFWIENVVRFSGGKGMNAQAWWYYLPQFLRWAFPWSLIFIGVIYCSFESSKWNLRQKVNASNLSLVIGSVWFFLGIIIFSLSAGKRDSYLLPLLPAMAIALVPALYRWGSSLPRPQIFGIADGIISLCISALLVLLAALPLLPPRNDSAGQLQAAFHLHAGALEALVSIVFFFALLSRYPSRVPLRLKLQCASCITALTLLVTISIGFGAKRELKYFKQAASQILEIVPARAKLLCIKPTFLEFFDPYFFYLKRQVEIRRHLGKGSYRGYLLINSSRFRRIRLLQHQNIDSRIVLRIRQFDKSDVSRRQKEVMLIRVRHAQIR